MQYSLQISAVNGETFITLVTNDKKEVSAMLTEKDHEGSTISLIVRADDEEVYGLLKGDE